MSSVPDTPPASLTSEMRFTVIDSRSTISFVATAGSLKPLVAACSHNPNSLDEFLRALALYDDQLAADVQGGLAIFDEHITDETPERIGQLFAGHAAHVSAVFRVLDERSREESFRAVRGGLILFNLKARRIVQVHNNVLKVRRRDRGRVRQGGVPVEGELYAYALPPEWSLVP